MRADRAGISLLEVVVALFIIGIAAGGAFSVAAMEHGVAVRAATISEVNALAELKLNAYVIERRAPSADDSLFRRFTAPFEDAEWRVERQLIGNSRLIEIAVVVRSGNAERTLATLVNIDSVE